MKGRKANVGLLCFGEAVLFKLPMAGQKPGDLESRFEKGVWVGVTIRSGEHLVAMPDGVFRVANVFRCPGDEVVSRHDH